MKNESDNQTPPLPTHAELMQIAINLTRTPNASPDNIVCDAMRHWKSLWQSAERVIAIEKQNRASFENFAAKIEALPKPARFPISRDEFFGIVLPYLKSHPTERAERAKAHIRAGLRMDLNPGARVESDIKREPTDDEVNKAYKKWPPIKNLVDFQQEALSFHHWHKKRVSLTKATNAKSKGEKVESAPAKVKKIPAKKSRKNRLEKN